MILNLSLRILIIVTGMILTGNACAYPNPSGSIYYPKWESVSLDDTSDFDTECIYRVALPSASLNIPNLTNVTRKEIVHKTPSQDSNEEFLPWRITSKAKHLYTNEDGTLQKNRVTLKVLKLERFCTVQHPTTKFFSLVTDEELESFKQMLDAERLIRETGCKAWLSHINKYWSNLSLSK
jgi:hypothetical protein